MTRSFPLAFAGILALAAACAPAPAGDGSTAENLAQVPGSVTVDGMTVSVEDDYIPHVVQCENPGATTESLKVQAIAARTYLTYRTKGQATPSIADGQGEQVYSCNSNQHGAYVPDAVKQAVAATRGQILTYGGKVIAGFFVAGSVRSSSSDCSPTNDPTHTEKYVTYNEGKSGSDVDGTTLGNTSDPANRGAMGQNMSNCLAKYQGNSAAQILGYFYGADIGLTGVTSIPQVNTPTTPDPTDDGGMTSTPDGGTVTPPPPTCFSYTLQGSVEAGACVQSNTDNIWRQCDQQGNWDQPVDATAGTGPIGPCTSMYPLS